MKPFPSLTGIADVLLATAEDLRSFSDTNLSQGLISKESQLAARIEGISVEVRELAADRKLAADRAND